MAKGPKDNRPSNRVASKAKLDIEALNKPKVSAEDRDSLHTLSLAAIPLATPGLRKGKLIKNARLETAIELFRDKDAGSGQVSPEDFGELFPSYKDEVEKDRPTIERLSQLPSFDVYSLRIGLRKIGISVETDEALSLSGEKKEELNERMREFMGPLLTNIYGGGQDTDSYRETIQMFSLHDGKAVFENLKKVSLSLMVPLNDLTDFLQDYTDTYQSIAYFDKTFKDMLPHAKTFLKWSNEAAKSSAVRNNKRLAKQFSEMETDMRSLMGAINTRINGFSNRFLNAWKNADGEEFRKLRLDLVANHTNLGAVLCGLAVKLSLYTEKFPAASGGMEKRIDFITAEIIPGLDHLLKIEKGASLEH